MGHAAARFQPLHRIEQPARVRRRTQQVGRLLEGLIVLEGDHDHGLAAGSVLIEIHDEWQVSDRRYLSEGSMVQIRAVDPDSSKQVAVSEITAS